MNDTSSQDSPGTVGEMAKTTLGRHIGYLFEEASDVDESENDVDEDDEADSLDEDDRSTTSDVETEQDNPTSGSPELRGQRDNHQHHSSTRVNRNDVDFDAIDARILELAYQKLNRTRIAERINTEFNVQWHTKTIAKRYRSILIAHRQLKDAELDIQMRDWSTEDDTALKQCHRLIIDELESKIQQLRNKVWKDVSDRIRDQDGERVRSARACQERYEALEAGIISSPNDDATHSESRTALLEAQRKRFVQARDDILHAQAAEKQSKLQQFHQVELRKAKAAEEQTRHALNLAAEQVRREEYKQSADERYEREKRQAEWVVVRMREENKLIARLEQAGGKRLRGRPRARLTQEAGTSEGSTAKKAKREQSGTVTKETLENPRSVMSTTELDGLLFSRGLQRRGQDEDHAQLVARLARADDDCTVAELDELLMVRFFKTSRETKQAKIKKIQLEDARVSAKGKAGVRSTDDSFKQGYEMYALHSISP